MKDEFEAGWPGQDPVATSARRWPEAIACVDLAAGKSVTYAELDAMVGRYAAVLAERLPTPGARVASLMRNRLEAVALMFACERAGAIYAPLNWRLSPVELEAIAADCAPALGVFEPEFEAGAVAAFAGIPAPTVDEMADLASQTPPIEKPAEGDAPCLILYTSGTTGRAKGVVLTRQALFWGARNFSIVGEVNETSVMLCDTPMFHTVALVATTRCALQHGGKVLISDRFAPDVALARLGDPALAITHFFCVPQIAQMLVDAPSYEPSKLSHLKGLFTGGAPLPEPLARRLLDDGVTIVQGFGMTETSTITGMPLDPAQIAERPASSGTIAPHVEICIADRDGRLLPVGEVGEICVRGPGLATGYWAQTEATAQAFRDGWFRSGDAGRIDEAGHLFVVDRWKDMYISGGENVYPAEIESVLAGLPGVQEAAVIGVPDERWGEVGCAVVVAELGTGLTKADVVNHCAASLARYKVPAVVRFVDILPRTGSGKVRKDVLRKLIAE